VFQSNTTPWMELRFCQLAEVEPGNMDLGVPGPSTSVTEGSGELVPFSMSQNSVNELATEAGSSYSDAADLKGGDLP